MTMVQRAPASTTPTESPSLMGKRREPHTPTPLKKVLFKKMRSQEEEAAAAATAINNASPAPASAMATATASVPRPLPPRALAESSLSPGRAYLAFMAETVRVHNDDIRSAFVNMYLAIKERNTAARESALVAESMAARYADLSDGNVINIDWNTSQVIHKMMDLLKCEREMVSTYLRAVEDVASKMVTFEAVFKLRRGAFHSFQRDMQRE
jgi:hypothetical protein